MQLGWSADEGDQMDGVLQQPHPAACAASSGLKNFQGKTCSTFPQPPTQQSISRCTNTLAVQTGMALQQAHHCCGYLLWMAATKLPRLLKRLLWLARFFLRPPALVVTSMDGRRVPHGPGSI